MALEHQADYAGATAAVAGTFAELAQFILFSSAISFKPTGAVKMSAGQSSGTGAMTEFEDEKVRKDEILSNRQKAQRKPGQSLDGKGVQVDEYKDNPANRRPSMDDGQQPEVVAVGGETSEPTPNTNSTKSMEASGAVDRPGFDLDGSTGETVAGKGLGLGADAMKGRKGWKLPR